MLKRNQRTSVYTITLKTVKNRSAEYYLAYYSLFILALIEFSLTDPIDLTVLSLLLLVLGIVYVKNDLFFMNPTINIFQSYIYEIEYMTNQATISKIIISPVKLSEGNIIDVDVSEFEFTFLGGNMKIEIKQRIEQIRRGEVPESYKQIGQNVIPQTWKRLSFEQVATVRSGLVSPKTKPYSSMLHIGPENIEKHTGKIENVRSASELGLISGKFYFDSSSIVYSKIRPNLNKVCVPNFEGICSADCYSIQVKDNIDKNYLFALMLSHQFYKRAVACSMRTGMPKINQDDLNAICLVLPDNLEEQQKIAAILTTQDKVIELKEKRLAEKQRQKKYLMQQLLTGKSACRGLVGSGKTKLKIYCMKEKHILPKGWIILMLHYQRKVFSLKVNGMTEIIL